MKFSDLFVPKYMNSVPEVRMKAVRSLKDHKLLEQISQKDQDEQVRDLARKRLDDLKDMRGVA